MRETTGTLTAKERADVEKILSEVLAKLEPPEGSAVVMEGSLGEGFANPSSDYDLTFVADTEQALPSAPTYVFVEGRRVEVLWKSTGVLRELAERVNGCSVEKADSLTFFDLMAYQRFCNSAIVRDTPFLRQAKSWFRLEHVAAVIAERSRQRSLSYARRGLALRELDRVDLAIGWCASALEFAALRWAASHGESYLDHKYLKWLPLQLTRARAPSELTDTLWSLLSPRQRSAAGIFSDMLEAIERFGVSPVKPQEPLMATRGSETETYSVAGTTYVLRGHAIYMLSPEAGQVWQALEQGIPLHEGPQKLTVAGEALGRQILFCLHDKGLLALVLGDGDVWERDCSAPPDPWTAPFLCARGALPAEGGRPAHVWRLPLSAKDFVSGFGHLMYTHMTMENSLEDAWGAAAAGQHRVAQQALRNLVRLTAQAVCLAHGYAMPPPQEEAVVRMSQIPGLDLALVEQAAALEQLVVDSDESAKGALAEARAFLSNIPERLRAPYFEGITSSIEVYERWIRVGFEAMLLAHRTDAPVPNPHAHDLLKFFPSGAQPRVKQKRGGAE